MSRHPRVLAVDDESLIRMSLSIVLAREGYEVDTAGSGMDFRDTAINSTNEIQLAQSGKVITAGGQLSVDKFQLARTNQVTPVLDLRAAYNLVVDTTRSNMLINGLMMTGTQSGNPLLNAQLTSPMAISWGGGASGGVGDSALTMQLNRLNLADWVLFWADHLAILFLPVVFLHFWGTGSTKALSEGLKAALDTQRR